MEEINRDILSVRNRVKKRVSVACPWKEKQINITGLKKRALFFVFKEKTVKSEDELVY